MHEVVAFKKPTSTSDEPVSLSQGLRNLADAIDKGEHGNVQVVTWVLADDQHVAVGCLPVATGVAESHFMLAIAQDILRNPESDSD